MAVVFMRIKRLGFFKEDIAFLDKDGTDYCLSHNLDNNAMFTYVGHTSLILMWFLIFLNVNFMFQC